MSVRDLNKVINVTSSMTGKTIINMEYDEFLKNGYAAEYLYSKIGQYIENGEGCLVKLGERL